MRLHDLESSEDRILGTHDKAVKTIEFMEESGNHWDFDCWYMRNI